MKHEFVVNMDGDKTKIFFTHSIYVKTKGIYIGSIVSENDEECPGEPWADITVCLPGFVLGENEVIIPTYNLDKDTYKVVKKNLIEAEIRDIHHGYATSKLVRLKPNWKDLVEELDNASDEEVEARMDYPSR